MSDGRADGVQPLNAVSVMELTGGVPVVVMWNVSAEPAANVAALTLVMDGAAVVPVPV